MSLTRPLTRPLTRKISRADLTQGFGGSFSPFALNPYLLFDARDSMVGTLENPTLDLNPALPETLDVITATRAGTATFTDVNGLIASASPNTVRVDQTQGAELTPTKFQRVGYSTPDSNWATVNSTLVENFEAAPDGTQSASKVTKLAVSGTGSSNDRIKYPTISIANGTTYSVSVHLKNIDVTGFTTIAARISGGSLVRVKFIWNTSALSIASGTTSNRLVEDVGNGWYRVSFSFESNGTAADLEIDIDRSSGGREDTSSILVWGAQLEEGTTASDFVANTTGSPKFITGATFGPRVPMILVEPSATNLLSYSEDFSNSYWGKYDTTVAPAPVSAPDGTMTASHVVKTGSNGHIATTNVGAANTHTASIWARTVSGSGTCFFSGNGGVIQTVTEEWQRFEVTSSNSHMYAANFRGASTLTEVYIWGAQLEEGIATSYIPTSGSTVTRAADDLEISGSAFSSFFNQSEGTVYTEFVPKRVDTSRQLYEFSSSNLSNRINAYLTNSNAYIYINRGGTNMVHSLVGSGLATEELHRMAVSYKNNDVRASVDGGAEITDTTVTMPTTINIVHLGDYTGKDGDYLLTGHIKRFIYWPYHSDSL